jgi:hypothetical protein
VVWQRLFVRPLVPDIGQIPEEERAYYEDFMCTSFHNPNRVDLSQDVLFELVSEGYARRALALIDENVWDPVDKALKIFSDTLRRARKKRDEKASVLLSDQLTRGRALRCLFKTLRNTAAWIACVYGYLGHPDPALRAENSAGLKDMIENEIQNTRDLLNLWEDSDIEWMIVSGGEETPFIYGANFPELLREKIRLMEKYRDLEPFFDPEYMFRVKDSP